MSGINKLLFTASTKKEILNRKKTQTYKWRLGKIDYSKQGSGTPLLLIHDLIPGSSDFEWKEIVKPLSKTHTVYTLDLLGFGRSEKPAVTYTNYLYVQLITDFIKNIIGMRCDVITSGSSAAIAVMACQMENDLFRRMILISPDSLPKTEQIPDRQSKAKKILLELPLIGTFFYNMAINRCRMKRNFEKRYFSDSFKMTNQILDAYEKAAHLYGANSRYVYSSLKGNYINFTVSRALTKISNPIYIINGSDTSGRQQIVKEYQQKNKNIKADIVYHSKHFPQLENPEELLKYCLRFLE